MEELKQMGVDSQEDLKRALEEMEGYSKLLAAFDQKVKAAEDAKLNAENERDQAMEEVKKIRQRYINILDNKSLESNI